MQLKEQAKENILAAQNNLAGAAFQNSEKLLTPINTTKELAGQSAKPFVNSQKVSEVQKENLVFAANKTNNTPFVNSQKAIIPVNTTKELAAELKTSDQTASRIIQIQVKADEPTKEKT